MTGRPFTRISRIVRRHFGRGAGAPPAPPSPTVAPVLASLEAQDFVARDDAAAFDRFALIAQALDSAVLRDREGLAMIEAVEANPKAHGRTHGLEWAYEQLFQDAARLRQGAVLLRALAQHEPAIRALIATDGGRA